MRVCVIGGGVIGLFSAWYLVRSGYKVCLVDRNNFNEGASHGNAGMICPSHFTPLAAPGVVRQSLKWMFDSCSPFYIKPRFDPDFIRWGLQFFRKANSRHVKASIGPLSALLQWSSSLYRDLAEQGMDLSLSQRGIIMACKGRHTLDEEGHIAGQASKIGIRTRILSSGEIHDLNPGVRFKLAGGVHYLDDMHLVPEKLMKSLKAGLSGKIEMLSGSEVTGFHRKNDCIERALTNSGEIRADFFVLAGGAWTGKLAKMAGEYAAIEPGKGYNITIPEANPQLSSPMILVEDRVAITPMDQALRLGGTMELSGINDQVLTQRVTGILRAIESCLPDFPMDQTAGLKPWFGFRPLSPTGLPVIAPLGRLRNVMINAGHGMLGLSLAPASGKLINQLITDHVRGES
jgi:D-amino-acid dehydrogenase